jgi:hypothetical protein
VFPDLFRRIKRLLFIGYGFKKNITYYLVLKEFDIIRGYVFRKSLSSAYSSLSCPPSFAHHIYVAPQQLKAHQNEREVKLFQNHDFTIEFHFYGTP